MWVCVRCGERNDESLAACSNCAGIRAAGAAGGLACPACGAWVSAGDDVCPGCGAPAAGPASRLVKVWSATNSIEAELLRVALRRAGIESILENAGGADYAIGLGTGLVPYIISVSDRDAPKALEVLRAEREAPEPGGSGHPDRYIPPVAMIRFPCDCGRTLEVPPDFDGLEMDCPFCSRPVRARKSS